jgi:hypothetical protein
MNFQLIADASPEIETWKMIVTLVCAFITLGGTWLTVTLSGRLKRKEQHYGAQIDKALQDHKAELDRQAKEYEAQLQHFAFENQTKFARLHSDRAKVIVKFHSLLLKSRAFLDEPLPIGAKGGIRYPLTGFEESFISLDTYFRANRLYFSTDLANRIADLINYIAQMQLSYRESLDTDPEGQLIIYSRQEAERAEKLDDTVAAIEQEFREMLGSDKKKGQ